MVNGSLERVGRSFEMDFYPFATTFNWQQYNERLGHQMRDTVEIAGWDLEAQTGIMGYGYLLGNLMFVVSDELEDEVVSLDMTPAFNGTGDPIVLDRITQNGRGEGQVLTYRASGGIIWC